MKEQDLAEQCKKRNTKAEKEVFLRYGAMLRGVCFRYATDADEAEDMFQEGFIRIFDTISSFNWQGNGSFTAWMRRVMVNNAINYYKKTKRLKLWNVESEDSFEHVPDENEEIQNEDPYGYSAIVAADISQQALLSILNQLPEIYKIVFNLSVIDGMKHKEIATILGIDESSSRSRLLRSKTMIRELLREFMINRKHAMYSEININN